MKANTTIPLLDEFKKWCKEEFHSGAASDYPSRMKRLNRDFISHLSTGTKSTPFELLEKYLNSSEKGPKIKLITSFLDALRNCITKKLIALKAETMPTPSVAEFNSERSAFSKYVEFLSSHIKSKPYRTEAIRPTEEAVIAMLNGDIIVKDNDDLIANFTQRIYTQDRPSGNKPLFPLGLIDKLPGNNLRNWAKEEASKVIFHLADKTVTVAEIKELRIDTKSGVVTVDTKNGAKDAIVYNPPINGAKSDLRIFKINDAHLDHRPEIHKVLVDMKGKIPGLDFLTAEIKAAQKSLGFPGINTQNMERIYSIVLSSQKFKKAITPALIKQIMDDIEAVSKEHILQFSSAKWNQSDIKQAQKFQTKSK